MPHARMLRLNPETVVLHRRNGDLQFGWDPESSVIVPVESSADRRAVLDLIRLLDGTLRAPIMFGRAAEAGLPIERARHIISELIRSGHVVEDRPRQPRSVRVHGDGPLAEAISTRLSATSLTVVRSRSIRTLADVRRWRTDLVVLTDSLVWDPAFLKELIEIDAVHLQVRVRDGKGIVGPLVVPGVTSCLHCADLTRSAYEPEWPLLAAQLLGKKGIAGPDTISATTAFTVSQIIGQLCSDRPTAAVTANTTVEICTKRLEIGKRHWPTHPDCPCQNLHNDPRRLANTVS